MAWWKLNHRPWTLGAVIHGNIAQLNAAKYVEQPLILKTFWPPIAEFNALAANYAPEQQVPNEEIAENSVEMVEKLAEIPASKGKLFVSIVHLFVVACSKKRL